MSLAWPRHRDAELISIWNDGHSASEIAKAMGKTRCAVIGRIYRLRRHDIVLRTGQNYRPSMPRPSSAVIYTSGIPARKYTPEDCFTPAGIDAELDELSRS